MCNFYHYVNSHSLPIALWHVKRTVTHTGGQGQTHGTLCVTFIITSTHIVSLLRCGMLKGLSGGQLNAMASLLPQILYTISQQLIRLFQKFFFSLKANSRLEASCTRDQSKLFFKVLQAGFENQNFTTDFAYKKVQTKCDGVLASPNLHRQLILIKSTTIRNYFKKSVLQNHFLIV